VRFVQLREALQHHLDLVEEEAVAVVVVAYVRIEEGGRCGDERIE
jgi:hypothetical protein